MTIANSVSHLIQPFGPFAHKGVYIFFIVVLLLIINRIFLYLLLSKNYGHGRRKFIFKLFQDLFVFQFIRGLMQDWTTSRNTMKNSIKIVLPATFVSGANVHKKKGFKNVRFDSQKNINIDFGIDDPPVKIRFNREQRGQGIIPRNF